MIFIPLALRTCARCHHRESSAGGDYCDHALCNFERGPCSGRGCIFLAGSEDTKGFAAVEHAIRSMKIRSLHTVDGGIILAP